MANKKFILEEVLKDYLLVESYPREGSYEKLSQEITEYTKNYLQSDTSRNKSILKDITDSSDSLDYFQDFNTVGLKEKYKAHIQKVQEIRNNSLDALFYSSQLTKDNLESILDILKIDINKNMLNSLEMNLRALVSEELSVYINYESLLNYLYILPSKKIQRSDIAIDRNSGNIVILYNSDKTDFDSKKISIIANARDFTVSIISRKDGLAKFSGVYASKFPEAYFKIESLMETLIWQIIKSK